MNVNTALIKIDELIKDGFVIRDTKAFKKYLSYLPQDIKKRVLDAVSYDSGWLFVGADFASLEDRISALTTKDVNKLKVYTDGYDGHCLRAYAYFKNQMPLVREAQENERCFKIKQGGKILFAKVGDLITLPNGKKVPVEELYEKTN